MTISECAKILSGKDGFLLLTHKNPDGDTVMSAAALCRALRRKNKKAYLYRNSMITKKMLPFVDKLFAPESFVPKYVVSVDIATENLFPPEFEGKVDMAIDHHPTNSHFALSELVESEYSACGEIVLKLIRELTGKITKTEATLLYIALTTDTGAFQYANVNEQTFLSAAELLKAGADSQSVMMYFFRKASLSRLRLEGRIYSGMHVYHDGKLVIAPVTRKMMQESEAVEDDCDDLAGLSGRTENAVMNITIREMEDGSSRISVRSAPGFSSRAVCAAFGGGGHELASGCTIQASPEKAERLLLDVVEELCGEQL